MKTFARAADGRLVFTLHADDAAVLVQLMRQLSAYLRSEDVDTRATDRLFPRAYLDPTEEAAETKWQGAVHDDLRDGKLAAFDEIAALVDAAEPVKRGLVQVELDAGQETRLLLGINDARLTMAALADPGDPTSLTDWLGALVGGLTDLQLSELPETGLDTDDLA